MAKNAVAVKPEGSNAVANVHDYGDMAGEGFENLTAKDFTIPWISVLQSMSKLVQDGGATPGMLFNSGTGELIDGEQGVIFVPCYKEHTFVEWIPLDDGGGFVGRHDENSDVVKKAIADNNGEKFGKLKVGKNELIETHYVYGLLLDDEGKEKQTPAIIAFTSTKIKPMQRWFLAMSLLKGKPPLFSNRARITTVKQKNGIHTSFNLHIEPMIEGKKWSDVLINPKTEATLLQDAQTFKNFVVSGSAKVSYDAQDSADATATGGEKAPF